VVAAREEESFINIPPRSKGTAAGVVLKQRTRAVWTLSVSLFSEYRMDTPSVLGDAFESDWTHSNVALNATRLVMALLKDSKSKSQSQSQSQNQDANANNDAAVVEAEVSHVKEYLRVRYGRVKNVFKHYSASTTESFTMALNAFSDLINDCHIVDDGPCNLANIDMIFIGCNMLVGKVR
jgi:hypothetical protein